jgi:flavin reductase (DIM6/NTAB) family NADH-FMN oxidoreductase RutF
MNDHIEQVFGLVDREIWIVTAAAGGQRGGLVATWVSQGSIDKHTPTVMVGIAANHYTCELIDHSSAFALHLLRPDQMEVAWNFASGSGRDRDKLALLATHTEDSKSPILDDCLAWLDCQVFFHFDGGDRIYFFADVLSENVLGTGKPLSEAVLIDGATAEQRSTLMEYRDRDILAQRPKYREWREQISDRNR